MYFLVLTLLKAIYKLMKLRDICVLPLVMVHFFLLCVLVTSLMPGNEKILYNLNDSFLWANFQNCNIV